VKFASTRLISADIKGLVSFHEKLTGQTVEWLVPVFAETLHLWRQRYRDRREHGRTKLKWAVNQYLICQRNLPVSQEFDRFGSKLRSTRPSPDGAAERPAGKPVQGSLNRRQAVIGALTGTAGLPQPQWRCYFATRCGGAK
jgi:hypothetical protein